MISVIKHEKQHVKWFKKMISNFNNQNVLPSLIYLQTQENIYINRKVQESLKLHSHRFYHKKVAVGAKGC